jgi:predicted TIM-barrel fold metal-dependent hydrolase
MPKNKRKKGVGNIHSHHLIGDYIPDKIYKQQVEVYCKFLSSESFVRKVLGIPIFRPLIALFLGPQPIKTLKLLQAKKISKARKIHLKEMNKAKIDYSVVLLLDYAFAAALKKGEVLKPFNLQFQETAEELAKAPFRFFLFHAFDPRKDYAMDLLQHSLDNCGAIGIKLYPALGYDPRPGKNTEFHCTNEDLLDPDQSPEDRIRMLNDNLEAMYKFAEENNMPILTHCSPGGSSLVPIDEEDKPKLWNYTNPENFCELAGAYNLRICLAHMGGKIHLENDMANKARKWRETIIENIKTAHNHTDSTGKIYTDLSFDISRVLQDKEKLAIYIDDTRKYLDDEILGKYVMFGSDWPMGLLSFSEKNYIQPYWDELNPGQQELFLKDNIARFLFGESKQIPDRYIQFIKEKNRGRVPRLPAWVREQNGNYYLV